MKKLFALVLAVLMVASVFAGCQQTETVDLGTGYTYKSYTTALGSNWNPHAWETSADSDILSYLETPLVNMSIKNSETGEFQWTFEAATSVTDVTATNQDKLTQYKVTLPDGKTAADITSGYVFEIKLNPNMKWENGTPINADTYIYSMKQLLNSKMRNYRANLYYSGESAVAGALAYYNSEAPIYENDWIVPNAAGTAYEGYATSTSVKDGKVVATLNGEESVVYFSMSQDCLFFGASASFIYNDYGYGPAGYFNIPYTGDTSDPEKLPAYVKNAAKEGEDPVYVQDVYKKWKDSENAYGVIAATEELLSDMKALALNFGDNNPDAWNEFALRYTGNGEKVEYDGNVGCYKVDDYTIHYVCQTAIDRNYFLTSCTSNWLVYEELYEAGKDTTGELVTTNYGTSKETSMSYGTYKIESLQAGKQLVFTQNENWYDWEKTEDGKLVSYTDFEVDGKKIQQYQTTKIVIDVMEADAAKQAFLKGDLTVWSPMPDDLLEYATSDNLYKADETYTMSFFFNTGLEALKTMDASKGNTNSVVLSNVNFRKAMSLALDRTDFVSATEGWKPAYSLMNTLYYYDIYNDPTTSYRSSEQAMQGICNLYGVEYGAGKAYATLEEAYASITGYNLSEAKALMKTACEELVADGLYTAGQDIVIRVGWAKGALTSADEKQVAKINQYLNAALEGSGFGTITLEAVGSIEDRYGDVPKGEYAIGWGAWGGAAFYPFRNMQVYCDTDKYDVNELGCWDPKATTLTINVNGTDVTKTWYEWSGALIGTGEFANADFDTKLHITATMEEEYLKMYYRIPFAGTTSCTMLGDQVSFYTEDYNIMYGWGGLRLASWNYNDTEWYNYVQSQNGQLNYQ